MRERQCFRCGRVMDFENFIKNSGPNEKDYLARLWENDYIEFFCCHCYTFKMKFQPNIDCK